MVIKDTKYQVVINTVLIILSLMCVMPFILLLSSSITSETALVKTGYRFWPTEIDLSDGQYLHCQRLRNILFRDNCGNTDEPDADYFIRLPVVQKKSARKKYFCLLYFLYHVVQRWTSAWLHDVDTDVPY